MNPDEAKKIMADEDLRNVNWYNEGNLRENQVVITKDGNEWVVYVTDERANMVSASITKCISEDRALEILIKKARYGKRYLV